MAVIRRQEVLKHMTVIIKKVMMQKKYHHHFKIELGIHFFNSYSWNWISYLDLGSVL